MSRVRLWCLWLVMLALPLQGLAAVSMLHCGVRAAGPVSEKVAQAAGQAVAHAGHDHAAHVSQQAAAGADLADAGGDDGPTAGHKCAMCAFCGHCVAFDQFPKPLEFGEPEHASPPEPRVLIPALAVVVPDKPPRA